MKKVFILLVGLLATMAASISATAQEITITLYPGVNWISYPNAEAMDIASAFGNFTPAQGDIIKSQYTSSVYSNGGWMGGVTHLVPGCGYKYYSNRTEVVDFSFAQPASNVVATATPTGITATSAVVGGTVTVPEGGHVFLRGVCWGTEPAPDFDGNHTTEETGVGSFSSTLEGLDPNTTYYVRAFAVSDHGLAYGNELSFTTDYVYVDLGLPSGTLWATCNLGANLPEEYGDYFAWGETQPKDNFSWTNYQYCMGSFNTLTKYCNNPDIGYNGFTDDLTTLLPEDDAATANWGDDWCMPTDEEWQELYQNTTVTWTTRNGVNGRLFTASNGNSIFMPASGYCNESTPEATGIIGDYWTSSLDTDYPSGALSFFFNSSNYYIGFCNRLYGRNVRAVRRPVQNHAYVDLGLPSGLLWATCNVGADNPEDYGDYFAWGETTPKDVYNWSTYQYCNGSSSTLTKYCSKSSNGYNGFIDDLTTLLPEDDAATANWGSDWRMPTKEEWQELYNNTTVTWTTQNGVKGRLFTASNGNSLFLPAAGFRNGSNLGHAGSLGDYWSSSLDTSYPYGAWNFYFSSGNYDMSGYARSYGQSVRAVRVGSQN
jgi:uncharacterized protein (TIGR02145 family)